MLALEADNDGSWKLHSTKMMGFSVTWDVCFYCNAFYTNPCKQVIFGIHHYSLIMKACTNQYSLKVREKLQTLMANNGFMINMHIF